MLMFLFFLLSISPAHADVALIKTNPCAIVQTLVGSGPFPLINIPGQWQTYNASIGWTSPDGAYKVVNVPPFVAPLGQQATGAGTYSIDTQCNVTVTYQTVPLPPPPPFAQGLVVTSTSTPALNATYPIDPTTQSYITTEIVSLLENNAFTNGQQTIQIVDMNNIPHTFTVAQFKPFATAMALVVTGIIQGQSPAQVATIP